MVNSFVVDGNGNPVTEAYDEAIPVTVITQLRNLQVVDGLTLEDAITFLRQKLVPDGYHPYPFKVDTPESFLDKLRSLVATYRFRHRVEELKREGVDFSTYLYVPEVDPITGGIFHEREDHCHILKRIWKHTREGIHYKHKNLNCKRKPFFRKQILLVLGRGHSLLNKYYHIYLQGGGYFLCPHSKC